jgi:hypothetical protein
MTTFRLLKVHSTRAWYLAVVLLLSGCIAPALMFSPQGQLLWALLKPMVGLDPNEVNLFEQPLIKGRMQSLLGPNYDTAVSLLKTANEIQQEGPLFYLVSRYTPVPELAEKAGFVWNAETNQMAVMLISGGAPQIFAEQLNKQTQKVIPSWPAELADYANPAALQQKAVGVVAQQLAPALSPELSGALNVAVDPKAALKAKQMELTESAKAQLSPELQSAADIVAAPERAITAQTSNRVQQALSPLQQQQADAIVQVKQAEQAVIAAEAQVAQSLLQVQQSVGSTEAQQQHIDAQQQLLQAKQALEVAKAKAKALATVAQ